MCYYDNGDTGFYDDFGNPIDPNDMDYTMYAGPVDEYGSQQDCYYEQPQQPQQDYYEQPQQTYYEQPQPQQEEPEYFYIEPTYDPSQEDYYLVDEIGNKDHIKGRKNFKDFMNRNYGY